MDTFAWTDCCASTKAVHEARRGSRDPHFKERRTISARAHPCTWGDCRGRESRTIPAGEPHLVPTEFPGGEAGYADSAGRPVSMRVCHDCARDSVHVDLLCPTNLPLLTELATPVR